MKKAWELTRRGLPPELIDYQKSESIPWKEIGKLSSRKRKKGASEIEAITDAVIEFARKESMKDNPEPKTISAGLHASLIRGRLPDALFLSTDVRDVEVMALRAIVLFVLSDVDGLRDTLASVEELVDESPSASDQIRLSTVKVLLAAAERDTSVIMCVMEFDSLLEEHPQQVEEPLIETMFTLYVVGTLLREIGEEGRASRIADTLEKMATDREHRMFLALVENLRGHIASLQGNLEKAEEHYLELRRISEEMSFVLGLGMALNNIGTLRINALRLEEAMALFRESHKLMDMDVGRIVSLTNLGEIATILKSFEEAEEYLKEAVRLDQKTQRGIIEAYAWRAVLLSRIGLFKEASEFVRTTEKMALSSEKPMDMCAYLFARGTYEHLRNRSKKAISTFGELLEIAREGALFEYLIRAELEMSGVYVSLFSDTRKPDHLSKAAYHLNDLIQIAKEQELQSLYASALIIRSDMFAIAGQKWEAKSDLERVSKVAAHLDDRRLSSEVRLRLNALTSEDAVPHVDQSEVAESLDRLAGYKPAVSKPKEVPVPDLHTLIALDRASGLPVYVFNFGEKVEMDSSLLSGFISAIASFSTEIMGETGLLRSITHEGFTFMMEHSAGLIIALIADEETFNVRYLLNIFAKRFEEKFPHAVGTEGVDTSKYQGADELTSDVFAEVLGRNERQ
jgi:tetratricopeptide (TPR) repeat protein